MSDIRKLIRRNNNVICDVCGRKRKRSDKVLAFGTGDIAVIVSCIDGCADTRHPLNDAPPVIFDGQPVPDARPDISATNATYVNTVVPSGMTWGHLVNGGTWGNMNNGNSQFSMNLPWTWGAFSRG